METVFDNQHLIRRQARTIKYLERIKPESLSKKLLKLHAAHQNFDTVCAGMVHHHYWVGGLSDHIHEMIEFLLEIVEAPERSNGRVTESDIIVSVFLHDFAKVWAYAPLDSGATSSRRQSPLQIFGYTSGNFNMLDHEHKTAVELMKFGIELTEQQWSAVVFAEGGWSDANFCFGGISKTANTASNATPLPVYIHIADLYSSQTLSKSLK